MFDAVSASWVHVYTLQIKPAWRDLFIPGRQGVPDSGINTARPGSHGPRSWTAWATSPGVLGTKYGVGNHVHGERKMAIRAADSNKLPRSPTDLNMDPICRPRSSSPSARRASAKCCVACR